jgi:flagellar hook-basal body complex protein FliE
MTPLVPPGPVVTPLERGVWAPVERPAPAPPGPTRGLEGVEGTETTPSFADLFKRALGDASSLEHEAQELIAAFLRGEPVELHQVMAASEEAGIALELLVEIRNKLTEAYRSVMNMQ